MMQFSVAPFRVLSEDDFKIIKKMIALHEKFAPTILELARNASVTGEPILRALEYVFPNEGFEHTLDSFMLGNDVLVAPVYEKGARSRKVSLPRGTWEDDMGVTYEGGAEYTVEVPVDRLLHFFRKG